MTSHGSYCATQRTSHTPTSPTTRCKRWLPVPYKKRRSWPVADPTAPVLIALAGSRLGGCGKVADVAVSDTMRLSDEGAQVLGVWEEGARRMIVRRDQLTTRTQFAGTLLHELAHAQRRRA